MTTFEAVTEAFKAGKRQYEEMMTGKGPSSFDALGEYGDTEGSRGLRSRIAFGDNLEYMLELIKKEDMAGSLQMIYVDPPFFSKGKYQASIRLDSERLGRSDLIKAGAYDDCWGSDLARYIAMLTPRLFLMRELLSEEGCLWLHLDWHVVHYAKVILDEIFGADNFVNEVIWTYKSGGANKRSFARKHDTLLLYAKGEGYYFDPLREKSYNRGYKPYRFKGVEEFQDEKGWYTMVNMKDVWSIDMVGRTSSERNGYATQKPEKLLERIVKSCSREGDICADFFAGSGTLGSVCERLGRKWIMCDAGKLAAACQTARMGEQGAPFTSFVQQPRHIDAASKGKIKARIDNGEVILEDYIVAPAGESCILSGTDGKGAKEIARYIQQDSLSLVKCWSVDEAYDGSVHRTDKLMTDGQRRYVLKDKNAGRISIMGYDVLGNMFFDVVSR